MKFIAFKGTYEKDYFIYEFDGGNWYLRIDKRGHGFQKDEVEKYSPRFLKAQTLEGVKEEVRIAEFEDKYGTGDCGDVQCPNCGFWHSFECYGYDTGLNESFNEKRECLCGKTFEFKIKEVKAIWETKEI